MKNDFNKIVCINSYIRDEALKKIVEPSAQAARSHITVQAAEDTAKHVVQHVLSEALLKCNHRTR